MMGASTTVCCYFLFSIVLVFCVPGSSTASLVASEAAAGPCRVTINDQDVTNEYFVVDSTVPTPAATTTTTQTAAAAVPSYVNCTEHAKCQDAIIANCPVVKFYDSEACYSAQIVNFTD